MPFKFNDALSYILEFSVNTLRVFNANGLIIGSPFTPTVISQVAGKYGLYNVTFTIGMGHGISVGQTVLLSGYAALGQPHVDGYWTVSAITSTTVKINSIPNGIGGVTSGGSLTPEVVISTPYGENEFRHIQVAQANDVMYVVHPSFNPRRLVRSSDTSWAFATYSRTADPFTTTGLYPSAVCFHQQSIVMGGSSTNPLTFYKSVPGSFNDFTLGSGATDAVSYTFSAETFASIRSIKSVDGALIFTCSDKNRRVAGDIQATSPPQIQDIDTDGSAAITPAANDRALISVTKDLRRVKSISYEYNANGAVATEITKASDHLTISGITQLCFQTFFNNTNWVLKADGTMIGLNQDLQEGVMGWYRFTTRRGDLILSIAPRAVDGGFDELWMVVEREVAGERVKYIEKMVLDLDMKEREDFYSGNETQDNEDFERYLYEEQKQKIHLDCSLTYDGSDHASSMALTALTGELVTVTLSANRFVSTDVGREIWAKDGNGKLEIETYISATKVSGRVKQDFDTLNFASGQYYLTTGTVAGLSHLELNSVTVVRDGAPVYDLIVENGEIAIGKQSSVVHVGLPYIGWIKSQDLVGEASNQRKNISKVGIRFQNSLGASVGTTRYTMEKIPSRTSVSRYSRPPALFTGFKDVVISDSHEKEKCIYIKQDVPAPCVVQMIKPYTTIGEV